MQHEAGKLITSFARSRIGMKTVPNGFPPTSTLWQRKSPKIAAENCTASTCQADGTDLPDSLTPFHGDAISSPVLSTFALRAAGAERIRHRRPLDRRADLGTAPRLPGDQPGRHHAGAG